MNKEKACWYIPDNNKEYREGYLIEILPPTHEQIRPFSCVVMDAETGFLHHSSTVYMKHVGNKDLSKYHPSLRDNIPNAKDILILDIDDKSLLLRKSNIGDLFWLVYGNNGKVHLVEFKDRYVNRFDKSKEVLIPNFRLIGTEASGISFNLEEWYKTDIARVYSPEGNIIQYRTSQECVS